MFHLEPGPEIQSHKNQEREGDDITVLSSYQNVRWFVCFFCCNLYDSVMTLDTTSRGLLFLDVGSSPGLLRAWQHRDHQFGKHSIGTFIMKL